MPCEAMPTEWMLRLLKNVRNSCNRIVLGKLLGEQNITWNRGEIGWLSSWVVGWLSNWVAG